MKRMSYQLEVVSDTPPQYLKTLGARPALYHVNRDGN